LEQSLPFSPKGWNNAAQGNALGMGPPFEIEAL
jgi:hypothetical protein